MKTHEDACPHCEQPSSDYFCSSIGDDIALPLGDIAEWAVMLGIIQLATD